MIFLRNKKGATLTEMLVVILVILAMVGASIPAYFWFKKNRENQKQNSTNPVGVLEIQEVPAQVLQQLPV